MEGFVVTMHEGSVLITIITWQFQFHPINVSIIHLKYEYRVREARAVLHATPIVTSRSVP